MTPNIILLDAINEKLEFPELKNRALSNTMSMLMDTLSKLKLRVSRSYRNFALRVFLFRITLRVAAKTSYRELIQSRTSSRTASSGIPRHSGQNNWSSNVLHFLTGRTTTLWTARRWR